jgi:hypothetical protein
MHKKTQVLVISLFLLFILGALSAGVAHTIQVESQIQQSWRMGMTAFYLAQAGVERAKIELLNNVNYATSTDFVDLDVAGDNYNFYYDCTIDAIGNTRKVTGIGEVTDLTLPRANAKVLAHREIEVTLEGVSCMLPAVKDFDDTINKVDFSWKEK